VVFGKKDNTNAVNLSSVASGSGGFVINGEDTNTAGQSGTAVSPLITKPPVPAAMLDKLMVAVLVLPNTT
jgi:hypothetical protein